MKNDVLVEDGWTLATPAEADLDELMGWFVDAKAVDRWSGPRFRYPFTPESFRDDCRIGHITTYSLKNPDQAMAAFGQIYERYDRAHLARLITHPGMRRQGIGKRLIRMLMRAAYLNWGHEQSSLFVYKDNEAAYRLYLETGFIVQEYPDEAPWKDRCYFLTRKNEPAST